MAKKILIVTKDRMEFNLYHPVALALEKAGCEVIVVAEGLSMDLWNKSGRPIHKGQPFAGSCDPNTLIRTDIDPLETLRTLSPDIVMTGLADPIHLGERFGLAANQLGIKLGYVEDLCFVHRRSKAIPKFICTPDAYGEKKIMEHVLYRAKQLGDNYDYLFGNQPAVYVTGSPAMDVLKDVKPDSLTESIIQNHKAERVILIGGQDESTTPLVRGLLEASQRENGWLIIPRFHPKWMSDPSKAAFRDEWTRLLYLMEERHRVLWTPPSLDTRTLIPLATEVVSIYSNILIEAAGLGVLAISWMSDVGRERMRASFKTSDLMHFPQVELGAALEVRTADEYVSKIARVNLRHSHEAKRILNLDGKATERVTQVILAELG